MGGSSSKEAELAEQLRSTGRLDVQVLGRPGCGRQSLLERVCDRTFVQRDTAVMCIGIDFKRATVTYAESKEPVEVPVFLFRSCYSSFREFPSVIERSMRCHCVVYAYDITSRESFEDLRSWKSFTEKYKLSSTVVTVLVGCKLDLQEKRAVTLEEARAYSAEIGCAFHTEISSKQDLYVSELMQGIIKLVLERGLWEPKTPAAEVASTPAAEAAAGAAPAEGEPNPSCKDKES